MTSCTHCGQALEAGASFCGACGCRTAAAAAASHLHATQHAAREPAAAGLSGRVVAGRYRILSEIGAGGMGAVYRAEQISLKRTVALKLLRPELSADPALVQRFNAEAEIAARLAHPNTVTLYDFGQDGDGALFIAMELVQGQSLRSLLAEGPLPPPRAVTIAEQVSASLADAHAHGIVHRDLKPDNIMLTRLGKKSDVVRVLDFGIAKLRDDGDVTKMPMTRAGDLVGTPQYMAPEQIRGERVDGRTDVYALGAMLYEMVTGQVVFEATSLMAMLSKHLTEAPIPPRQRRPDLDIPPALDQLICAALAKRPEARPPSMERFGELLAEIGAGPQTPAPFAAPQPPAPFAGPPSPAPFAGPPSPAPFAGPPSPAPFAGPQPRVTAAPTPTPLRPRRAGRRAAWIAVAVVAAAAAGAVTLFRGQHTATSANAPATDAATPGRWWTAPQLGYSIKLPPGFSLHETRQHSVSFVGFLAGQQTVILVAATPLGAAQMTDAEISNAADTLVAQSNGTPVRQSFQSVGGVRRLAGVYDMGGGNLKHHYRVAYVVYAKRGFVAVVAIGCRRDHFAALAPWRRDLFAHGFRLP